MVYSMVQTDHGWLESVTINLQTLNPVENTTLHKHMVPQRIIWNTFVIYVTRITEIVELKITNMLPDHFAAVNDEWPSRAVRYVDVYAKFLSDDVNEYS